MESQQPLNMVPLAPRPILEQYLRNQGMTVSDLARAANISYNAAVRALDENRERIDVGVLRKIAGVFGCNPGDLIEPNSKSHTLGSGNEALDFQFFEFLKIQRRSSRSDATQEDIDKFLRYFTDDFRFFAPHHPDWRHHDSSLPSALPNSEWREKLTRGLTSQEAHEFNQFNRSAVEEPADYVSQPRYLMPVSDDVIVLYGTVIAIDREKSINDHLGYDTLTYSTACQITPKWHEVAKRSLLKFRRMTYLTYTHNSSAIGSTSNNGSVKNI